MTLAIVRVIELKADSMKVLFNDDIDTDVGVSNVSITSEIDSIANPDVLSVSVEDDIVSLIYRPLFANTQYKVTFFSTTQQSFQSVNGEAITEDGNNNIIFIVSPGEEANQIRDNLIDSISSTTYEIDEPTLVRDLAVSTAEQLQRISDSIETTRSANYLSVLSEDEKITRSDGPIDKLAHGGAFEILRVGQTTTTSNITTYIRFDSARSSSFEVRPNMYINSVIASIPADPISLQGVDVTNEAVSDDTSLNNYFSGLTINVSKSPVIQVISVSLFRDGEYTEYDIERFGYILKSNRYDTDTGAINVNLTNNQIELSTNSITGTSGGFLMPRAGDEIRISYVYKKLGRNVSATDTFVSSVESAVRETTPALTTSFSLDNAPIVTADDNIATSGGVIFYNTQPYNGQAALTTTHPAFLNEIPYDVARLPSKIGEYAVNYSTGEVTAYGEDAENNGTGESSPVASYYYRKIYVSDLDYTFNSDTDELSANSARDLIGTETKITFDYEDVFAAGEDFRVLSHVESLNERVNNKLIDAFTVQTTYSPVTDVFRIFNETTGELYTPTRFNDTSITFNGRAAPRQQEITREKIVFSRSTQEVLLISDELQNIPGLRVFKIELLNSGITNLYDRTLGSNFNSSVSFSQNDLFLREFFYEDELFTSITYNINRLQKVGDYIIDYTNGIVYIAVSSSQSNDVGNISYRYKKVDTKYPHILRADGIYKSKSTLVANAIDYTIGTITDTTVSIQNLEKSGERFINNNISRTLVVGTFQNGEDGATTSGSYTFTAYSGTFTSSDVGRTLVVGANSQPPIEEVEITKIIHDHEVEVDQAFTYTKKGRVWVIKDTSSSAPKTITLGYDIVSVIGVYKTSELDTLPFGSLTNYYDTTNDSFSGNIITLDDDNVLDHGEAVIVDYNYGNIFIDYTYLKDELIISYEYGNNALDWSINNSLVADQEYYVTYRYGALRDSLLLNFGSLTQMAQLTTFSSDLDRETYRSIVGGALQSFVEGPTKSSIENLVEAFTDVTPNITEMIFNKWTLGRDNLYLRDVEYHDSQRFSAGKYDVGAIIDNSKYIKVPAISHIKLNEGTFETWVRPYWNGMANDATLTFDLAINDASSVTDAYIGFLGVNPTTTPFSLSTSDTNISIVGEPQNIDTDTGFFIWFDTLENQWNIRWRGNALIKQEFSGTISTTGEFYNVIEPTGSDGYEINEITDVITSSIQSIKFTAYIDGYDAGADDGYTVTEDYYAMDGISFSSGDEHYIFDMACEETKNRMSIVKDGTGYLNFQVYDDSLNYRDFPGFYNLSTSVRSWSANEAHHVAVAWKFNTTNEYDEMHLFVDGEEVQNLFKYGGNPKATSSYDFGNVGEEIIVTSASRPVVGYNDGSSKAGTAIFTSDGVNFVTSGVQVGDSLYLLDATADGTEIPNSGAPYTISGVGEYALTLDRDLTVTLGDLNFSVNQVTKTVTTPINYQDFIVVTVDSSGNETELPGVDASLPSYSIRRGGNYTHVISINDGVSVNDQVVIKTLGLIFRRCREQSYVYGQSDTIRFNLPPPVNLGDVHLTPILLTRTLMSGVTDGYGDGYGLTSSIMSGCLVSILNSSYSDICQPSNQSAGRKLSVSIYGGNIDFAFPNQVIIHGTTYSGAISEILTFASESSIVTSEYWTFIDSVEINLVLIDDSKDGGVVEIRENQSITISENNGDFVEIVDYSNGVFTLETYGTGGLPFYIENCTYEIDYPSFLKINLDNVPDVFTIGCDFNVTKQFDGIMDEIRILDYMLSDTRTGETTASNQESITRNYNAVSAFTKNDNTLLLLHCDNSIEDESDFIDRFNNGFEVAPSVNTSFGTAIKFDDSRPYVISNANSVFNNDEGTIEFWVKPFDDTKNDENYHYYIDMSAVNEEEVTPSTRNTVVISQRAREIESVRLITDTFNTGVNYYTGGSLSTVDNKTITLGTPLQSTTVNVKVVYVPLSGQGDRVSIFRDPSGFISFFVKASGVEHIISLHVDWSRHTWHRIMAMWVTNSTNNQDRLRLFVDGEERGTIRYGTGLIYGTGVIWGQAEIRPGYNRFLVSNIDLTDTFSKIFVGTDYLEANSARALMDNLRFSEIQRLQSIKTVGNVNVDISYTANTTFAVPVYSDLYTSQIYNFDHVASDIEYLATVVGADTGIFRFTVEVIDSFDKVIGDSYLENLLVELIRIIQPSHCESVITFSS